MPRITLECALSGQDETSVPQRRGMAGRGGLIQLLRESSRRQDRAFWWVPLDVLARFNVSRHELAEEGDSPAARAVFREILLEIPAPALPGVPRAAGEPTPAAGPVHVHVLGTLQSRQLSRLRKTKPSTWGAKLDRWTIGDLVAAWREARYPGKNRPLV